MAIKSEEKRYTKKPLPHTVYEAEKLTEAARGHKGLPKWTTKVKPGAAERR